MVILQRDEQDLDFGSQSDGPCYCPCGGNGFQGVAQYGGGDPDRTGDPRLMSPLLCQLSYTATPREVAAQDTILPEEGSQCLRRGVPEFQCSGL